MGEITHFARGRGAAMSATYRLFREAILTGRQVTCTYQGRVRALCPHIIGHSRGAEVVLAWQFGGESSGSLPMWRCLYLDDVSDAALRDGLWHTGDYHRQTQTCVAEVDLDVNVHVRKLR